MRVIDWRGMNNDLIHAYRGEITLGDQLIVRENQQAVFFRDGKAYDVLGPGRHTLTTLNIPLLFNAYKVFFQGRTPFTAEVVFVNTSKIEFKFGTKQKVMLRDMVPCGAFGRCYIQISDPKLFVIEIVGNLGKFTKEDVKEFVEAFIIEKFIDNLAEQTSYNVYQQTSETSLFIKTRLRGDFERFGIDMVDLKIEGVTIPDEYKNKLFYLQRGVTPEQLVGKEIAEKFAEAIKETKGGGAAMGAGFMAIPYAMQGVSNLLTPQAAGVATVVCPNCGYQVPRNSKFCPNCGYKLSMPKAKIKCKKCGAEIPAGSKYCPNCGKKV
ncbi:MAG TPA: SPFH domain-containing protein [Methanomicrobia archaeon]|nr:SPFH domain-containing protein [Methanomicrobia archaeon]